MYYCSLCVYAGSTNNFYSNFPADGYVRSEAGVAILMQRKADAKRFYATVVGTESNCDGFKEYGCNTESLSSQIKLYRETLERFRLNPLDVSFVEAHGYATLVYIYSNYLRFHRQSIFFLGQIYEIIRLFVQ